ncbi:MAG: GNAT family N-acetyltransferase [Coriobacteriales bacterium]|nr:GNAT family N-acetyltransferase [Coriobacteriales bacterium]
MDATFAIRAAEERDLPYIQLICDEGGLASLTDVADVSVAVGDEGLPVGFIHIETVTDDTRPAANGAYVYPVAVLGAWQRRGVASALVAHAFEERGGLRLVACKPSQGFYPKVGFEPVPWERIAVRIARDCELCVAREACGPVPFALSGAGAR